MSEFDPKMFFKTLVLIIGGLVVAFYIEHKYGFALTHADPRQAVLGFMLLQSSGGGRSAMLISYIGLAFIFGMIMSLLFGKKLRRFAREYYQLKQGSE